MIYVTGDTHANQRRFLRHIHPHLQQGDTLIVVGDFGVGFWNGFYFSESLFYDWLSRQPYTVLFLDGNHEDFHKLSAWPVTTWHGGRVHAIRPNVLHLMRGEAFQLEEQTIFVMGGGYSIDQARREPGVSWWPEEMPCEAEYKNAEETLRRINYQADVILSHTAPGETVQYLVTKRSLGIRGDVVEERPLTGFLDTVQARTAYGRWFFGHFHIDQELWRNQYACLDVLRDLKTGKIVHQWGTNA